MLRELLGFDRTGASEGLSKGGQLIGQTHVLGATRTLRQSFGDLPAFD